MELKDESPVSDEERRAAESKQLSINPLDPTVKPEEYSDTYKVARHLRGPAIANAPNDIEQNVTPVMPAPSLVSPTSTKKAPPLRSVRAGMIGAIVFLVLVLGAIFVYALT